MAVGSIPEALYDELVLLNETAPELSVVQLINAFLEHHPEQDFEDVGVLLVALRNKNLSGESPATR